MPSHYRRDFELTLRCPVCGGGSEVRDSRPAIAEDGGLSWKRVRRCIDCRARFRTIERVEDDPRPPPRSELPEAAAHREWFARGL